ncbi:helitron_like_N domain-containing protein [Trichonephila clavipes]|nr:helitron_like_N domain-containing protein [Trichonephila clavipes]
MAKDRVTSGNYKVVIHPDRVPRGEYILVDMYVKKENERLRFIALNQTKQRAENYKHLQDVIMNEADLDPNSLCQMVILSSSFVNSARYLHEYTHDVFTYVLNYGRPDLFITMTCNPARPEITRELISGQNSTDRHDLTARVFKVKVQKLVALLTKAKIRKDRNIALAVASSGIAATLLSGGWTAHSVFKLSLNLLAKKPQRATSVRTVPAVPCCNNVN